MPTTVLANPNALHAGRRLDKLENFARWGARAKHRSYTHFVKGWPVVVGDDPSAEDDDILEASFNQLLADLWKQVSMRSRKRRKTKETCIFVANGVNDLLRGPSQAGVDDLVTSVPKGACNHFGSAVVAVKSGLGHHDAQRLVHGARTGRFPINATPLQRCSIWFLQEQPIRAA
jgi:hypothetical protein